MAVRKIERSDDELSTTRYVSPTPNKKPGGPIFKKPIFWIVVVLVVLLIGGAASCGGNNKSQETPNRSIESTEPAETSGEAAEAPSEEPAAEPATEASTETPDEPASEVATEEAAQTANLPNVVGMNMEDARAALEQAGFEEIDTVKPDGSTALVLVKKNWTVQAQSPGANTAADTSSTVTLTVSKEDSDTSSDEESSEPETKVYKKGQKVKVGDWTMKVKGVKEVSSVSAPYLGSLKADGKFVLVTVNVKNQDKKAATISDSSFTLVDKEGNEYDVTEENYYCSLYVDHYLYYEKINPGSTKKCVVVFDVPKKLKKYNLVASDGSWFGDSQTIKLK